MQKRGIQINVLFLISPHKRMLWVLIRSASLLMSTHNICLCYPQYILSYGEIKYSKVLVEKSTLSGAKACSTESKRSIGEQKGPDQTDLFLLIYLCSFSSEYAVITIVCCDDT